MNAIEKIMIFGGGMLQLSMIHKAKELGYFTIVVDPDQNAPGRNIADLFTILPGDDFEKTLQLAMSHKVKGIVTTATDKPLLMMARIAEKLCLPFPSVKAIDKTINKFKLKQILVKNNIPCAKGVLFDLNKLNDKLQQAGIVFPVVIKPIDSSGSRGVFYCQTKEELIQIYPESIKYSKCKKVLIEEYLEGPEISVEALVQGKKIHIIQITDKTITAFPYTVEMGHMQPSSFFSERYDEIFQILNKAVMALKLDNCALHPEMKITKAGVKIVEIGPRLGGDFITSHLTPLSTGINMEGQLLKIAVGETINLNITRNRYSAVMFFDFAKNKTNLVTLRKKITYLKNDISTFDFYYPDSSKFLIVTNSLERHGHVVFSADTPQELFSMQKTLTDEP